MTCDDSENERNAASFFRRLKIAPKLFLMSALIVWAVIKPSHGAVREVFECKMTRLSTCSLQTCEDWPLDYESVVRIIDGYSTEMGIPKDAPSLVEFCGGKNIGLDKCESFPVKWSDTGMRVTLIPRRDTGITLGGEIFLFLDTISNPPVLWSTHPLLGGIANFRGTCKFSSKRIE